MGEERLDREKLLKLHGVLLSLRRLGSSMAVEEAIRLCREVLGLKVRGEAKNGET